MRRFARRIPQHVDHCARRVGIGVIAIVQNQNSVVQNALAAHRAWRKVAYHVRQLLRTDADIDAATASPGQNIQDAVAAVQRALKLDAVDGETDAFGGLLDILGADCRSLG